ncbi:RISC-loading complex subunit tarbp2 isoform X2 [Bacillus rossius redtenbacheri]|uniref:RISC-loading complex subunit tarbp2 isoform X2 n=1 Tax=Bacillus rossius redtenbacheri TaxID=93214 RepID=UPI002FDDA1E5
MAVGKTPVSVLQELLSRRGTTPKYELVQIEGAIHEPTFRYRVTVADIVAMGIGRSKKEAKHAAAKAILDKIVVEGTEDGIGNNLIPEMKNEIVSPYDDKIPGNPIGNLQEMCMSRRWPPPSYELVNEEGLPHERLFTIACTVFKQRELGTGKSKKLAKRQAAHKMLEKLQDVQSVPSAMSPGLDDDDDEATALNNVEFNYVQLLQEIATEQDFEVTYVDIEEKSIKGKSQCLVQLSTLPVAVCYGTGSNSKEAQSAAAQNALEYLKIMTKK